MNPAQIIALVSAAGEILRVALALKTAAQQSKEWTPQVEAEFQRKLEDARKAPAWQVQY